MMLPALETGFDDPIIGHILFTDGVRRPVFHAPGGHEHVADEGERINGVWIDIAAADDSGA
jgi:hypothetical protein